MDIISELYNKANFKTNYLFNVWGEGSLAKTEGSLAAPYIYIFLIRFRVFVLCGLSFKIGLSPFQKRLWYILCIVGITILRVG